MFMVCIIKTTWINSFQFTKRGLILEFPITGPFYNAFTRHVAYFQVAHHSPTIGNQHEWTDLRQPLQGHFISSA
jgi:hypothetical protein